MTLSRIKFSKMAQSLVFNVTLGTSKLIAPSRPTPYEFKELSDIDDQESLRVQIPLIFFYRNRKHTGRSVLLRRDPTRVIKEALGKALVPYYPFAGRLREREGRKLVVECNGEGIMFVEANGDVTLDEFESANAIKPPFPLDKLLINVPSSSGVLDTPLMHIQVTRLICGGFILALRFNHTMADASGLILFLNAVAEFAHGAVSPPIEPVWMRHLLRARTPPQVTCEHPEYNKMLHTKGLISPLDDLVYETFFFGPKEVEILKSLIPAHKKPTKFEIITASLWRCRTIALQPDPEELVRVICVVNYRSKTDSFIPSGYYGNAFALPISITTARKLSTKPLEYALDHVQRLKAKVTQEYIQSVVDYLVLNDRPPVNMVRTFLISDATKAGLDHLDFGWGLPIFSGPADGGIREVPGVVSFYIPLKNDKGEKGTQVTLCLPRNAMNIFVKELHTLVGHDVKYMSNSST